MPGPLRVGRLLGIEIRLDLGLLVAFVLVATSLALGALPLWHPDWSAALTWAVAAASAVMFFGSVLVHELSHAMVARAFGLPVRDITLFLFGGIASIEREPPSALSEGLIAVVGPITSIAIGIGSLLIVGLASPSLADPAANPLELFQSLPPALTVLAWLGPINLVLAAFNLVPAFPLDGGRVARAVLWGVTGNLTLATRIAAGLGQGFGWILMAFGVAMVLGASVPVFGTGTLQGLWLAFIGWFLRNAAVSTLRQQEVREVLGQVSVSRLMRAPMATVAPSMRLQALVDDLLVPLDASALPVVENGRLVGVVTVEDVRKVPADAWRSTPVSEVMRTDEQIDTVEPTDDGAEALERSARRDVDPLPVVTEGRLVGVVRRHDLIRWLQLRPMR